MERGRGSWGDEQGGREGGRGRGGEISPPRSFLKVDAYDGHKKSMMTTT